MSCEVGLTKSCGSNSKTLQLILGDSSSSSSSSSSSNPPTKWHDLDDAEDDPAAGDEDSEQPGETHHVHRIGGARSDVFVTLGYVGRIANEKLLDSVRNANLDFAKAGILPAGHKAHRGKATPAGARVKAQKSTHPLVLFPPVFDTRLFYRSAHHPYVIHDQGTCASCVFISATTTAQVRAAIQLSKVNAAAVWRAILREERGSDDEIDDAGTVVGGSASSSSAFHNAARRFVELMGQQAQWGGVVAKGDYAEEISGSRAKVPQLQWKHYICCQTQQECNAGGGQGRESRCYHHKDEPSDRSAFTCDVHADGVVPHHFLEWIAEGDRGFVDGSNHRIIRTIRPEHQSMNPKYALAKPIEVAPGSELTERETRLIAEQVRAIKTSLMSNGPVLAMIRIEGKSFDMWGKIKKPTPKPQTHLKKASSPPAAASSAGGSSEEEQQDSEDGDEEQDENSLLGQVRRRRAYRLPARDKFDEYHEVMVIGWSYDDFGTPCWVIQNSYGPNFNSHCALSPWAAHEAEPWLGDLIEKAQRGYEDSGVMDQRGCVFVEMVNADLINSGCTTDLENNILSFIPVIDEAVLDGLHSKTKKEIMHIYSDPSTPSAGGAKNPSNHDEESPQQEPLIMWLVGMFLVAVAVAAIWVNINRLKPGTSATTPPPAHTLTATVASPAPT